MKTEILSDALDNMNDELIEKTALLRESRRERKNTRLAWAAALVFAAGLTAMSIAIVGRADKMKQANAVPTAAPTEAQTEAPILTEEVDPPSGEASMIPFFIYNGKEYLHFTSLDGEIRSDQLGEKLGTITKKIDEWSKASDYTELSGSVDGDFYEIKGFDPDFVLALSYFNGNWSPFVAGSGLKLDHGRELIEDRLNISELLSDITYEPSASWNWSMGEIYRLPVDDPEIMALIEAADAAEVISLEDVKRAEGKSDTGVINSLLYRLHLGLENGLTASIGLVEGGYILFSLGSTIDTAIVKVPEDVFGAVISMMDAKAGTPLFDGDPLGDALAECMNDPTLGRHIPSYVPEGIRPVNAEIMREGGESYLIMLNCNSSERDGAYYLIAITKDRGFEGDFVLTPETLSVEAINALIRHDVFDGREYLNLDAVLMLDDAAVELTSTDIDAETAYAILSSVNTETP